MDAVGFKFSPLFGGVAKTCAEGSEFYVFERKGDPMADKTNEGLNLAPRVAEGGEAAMLREALMLCRTRSIAAVALSTMKGSERLHASAKLLHEKFSAAADAIEDALNYI